MDFVDFFSDSGGVVQENVLSVMYFLELITLNIT